MKVLVTGIKGQLGSAVKSALEPVMPGQVVYTDVENLDITDINALEKTIVNDGVTTIVNCAAFTAVDAAEADPTECYRINADAVTNLASVASRYGVRILHISTDYVFDGTSNKPYRESDKVNPLSNYGASKRKGEVSILSMCPDAIILRTAWLYAPNGHNFVKTMLNIASQRSEVSVVCDQIGTPTYAADLADAIVAILTAKQWIPGIYHYSNEGAGSWYDFANAIFHIAGIKNCHVVPVNTEDYPTAAIRPHYSVLDKSLIKKTYGLTIPYWVDSLEKCINILNK